MSDGLGRDRPRARSPRPLIGWGAETERAYLEGSSSRQIEPDPIFAAIEHRRASTAAHIVALQDSAAEEKTNGAGLAEAKRRERAARNADTEAIRRLFGTVPATLLGVLALVRYAAECDAAGDDIWMVYMTDEDEPVYGYQALFASVIAALEKL